MFVKIPHHLGQEIKDLEHIDMEDEINWQWERIPHKLIAYIFYIKHRDPLLSCLLYFYECGSFSMRYINPNRPDCMENLALKLDNYELFSISQADRDKYTYARPCQPQFLENPYVIIKNGIQRLNINLSDCEIFICNWTRENIKSLSLKPKSVYKKISYDIEGYFTQLKDYSVIPPSWKLMTQKEIFDYNINFKEIYTPGLRLYTDGSEVTNENPSGNIYTDLQSIQPQYKSIVSSGYGEIHRENQYLEQISLKERVNQRDNLVMLHIIFKKLKSMGLEMLILYQMIPVPKYTIGSVVLDFKANYRTEKPLLIKDIYMYLDLNYSWNIKYLCADLNDIKKGAEVLNLTYYKQKKLEPIDFSYMYDVYDKIQTKDLKFKKLNSLFQGDVAIIERNRTADNCRKCHYRFRDKSNRNRCRKLWCPGPQKFILKKIIQDIPVIKVVDMKLDRIHSYTFKIYNKKLYKNLLEPEALHYVLKGRRDNVKIKWQYTRDF